MFWVKTQKRQDGGWSELAVSSKFEIAGRRPGRPKKRRHDDLLKFAHKILGKESDVLAWSPDLHSCAMY